MFTSYLQMPAKSEKGHLSIAICSRVESGKSTLTGRLIFELVGLPQRALDKLNQKVPRGGTGSLGFALYMDPQTEEREHGVTIASTTFQLMGHSCSSLLLRAGAVCL